MSEEPKSFTVKDRRHFTSEGETREAEEDVQAPAPPGRAAAAAPSDPAPTAPPPVSETGGAASSERPVDFAQFLLSLGTQASVLLSGQVEGVSPQESLAEARSLIGILEMLQDKTEGRRTPSEQQVLEGLLYELRMAYVARAREMGA